MVENWLFDPELWFFSWMQGSLVIILQTLCLFDPMGIQLRDRLNGMASLDFLNIGRYMGFDVVEMGQVILQLWEERLLWKPVEEEQRDQTSCLMSW